MNHLIVILFLMGLVGGLAWPAEAKDVAIEWQQIRDSEGIQVYSAKATATPIIKVKAIVVIDAGLDRLLAILDDETLYPRWVPYLSEAKVLEVVSPVEKLIYNLFDAPWPASDRDFIFRLVITSKAENKITYAMQSESSGLMPEQKGVVRARLMESAYSLTALNENQTRIEVIFHADPRGHLPIWIVNMIHRSFPYNAIIGLRTLLNSSVAAK